MSKYGGCIVCGVTLSRDEDLLCSDCTEEGHMKQTGAKARYIEISENGPIDVTQWVYDLMGDRIRLYSRE